MKKIYIVTKVSTFYNKIDIHTHDCWEIIYYDYGQGKINFFGLNRIMDFESGQLLIIPPNFAHEEISETGFHNICIQLPEFELSIAEPLFIRDNPTQKLYSMMQHLRDAFIEELAPNSDELLSSLYYALLAYIEKFMHAESLHPAVEIIKQAIINNCNNINFNLDDIYEQTHFNPDYVRKLFAKEMRLSPKAYLIEKRIEHAKKLLEYKSKNNYSVSEIAYMSGYNSPYYFSRIFKEKTGLSPLDYTKRALSFPDNS